MSEGYRENVRRVGIVLMLMGAADAGVMLYRFSDQDSHSVLGVVLIATGIWLWRGSSRAVGAVRFAAIAGILSVIGLNAASVVMFPTALIIAWLKFRTESFASNALLEAAVLALLIWVAASLDRAPIRAARSETSRRKYLVPAAAGVALAVTMSLLAGATLGGPEAERARTMAAERLGPGYTFHVTALSRTFSNAGGYVAANVTAWNEAEIREVPVEWRED